MALDRDLGYSDKLLRGKSRGKLLEVIYPKDIEVSSYKWGVKIRIKGKEIIYDEIVALSAGLLRAIKDLVLYILNSDVVLIEGESGVGKEVLYKIGVKVLSEVRGMEINSLAINCGALNGNLIESELFGHVKGSFTDAYRDRVGAFMSVGDGVLFLDEIGELAKEQQVKLLRAIEYREIRPVGSEEIKKHRAKVILATNRDLELEVKRGNFREDLWYRISMFRVSVPSLRDRREDIEGMLEYYLGGVEYRYSKGLREKLLGLEWRGNVRELYNGIKRAKVLSGYGSDELRFWMFIGTRDMLELRVRDVWSDKGDKGVGELFNNVGDSREIEYHKPLSIKEMRKKEREEIIKSLILYSGRVVDVVRDLGIPRSSLYLKFKEYGIDPNDYREIGEIKRKDKEKTDKEGEKQDTEPPKKY